MHNKSHKHLTKRKCHAFSHLSLHQLQHIRKHKGKGKDKKEKPVDSTVIVDQQTDPNRTAFEIALDKECLQEPSDAEQFVNSTFTCPWLESQT